jgi:hypothetical protein
VGDVGELLVELLFLLLLLFELSGVTGQEGFANFVGEEKDISLSVE